MNILGIIQIDFVWGRHKAPTKAREQAEDAAYLQLVHTARAEEHRAAADENESLARMYAQRIERLQAQPVPFRSTNPPGDSSP